MILKKTFLCICLLLLCKSTLQAQDFRCSVQIIADQVTLSDKSIFKKLENAMREFMNNRKWSTDKVLDNERIDCSITLTIDKFALPGYIEATAQIQSRRTVYGTNYSTQIFNFNDQNWMFSFNEFQQMDYYEGQNIYNLTSMMAYYAYIILGIDYDSFSPMGGTPYFTKAQNLVNVCQVTGEPGWKPNESKGNRNRFALIDNIFSPRFQPLRQAYYLYHRQGLDLMSKKVEDGRNNISKSLLEVQKVFKIAPNSIYLKTFFDAKSDEMINIYKGLPSNAEKQKMVDLLSQIDIANSNRYQNILKN